MQIVIFRTEYDDENCFEVMLKYQAITIHTLFYSYHQKYRLQGHKDLCRSIGLDSTKLQTSHLAARLNGYLVGVGGKTQFEKEVSQLGLSEKQAEYVRRELERNEGGGLAC